MIYSLDTETYYRDSKKKGAVNYSIRGLGNWLYCNHPEFDCYMLTIAGEDGFTYAGRPESFDWKIVQNQEIVMHNAGFDLSVVGRLVELGIAPADLSFADVFDTADLAAYLGFPRSLAAAAENLLGVTLDKSVRANANGVYWSDMDPDAQEAMTAYALADATNTLQIWLKHGQRWPADERRISEITREMCATGLPVDKARVLEACSQLQELLAKVRAQIPWADDPDAKALSKKEVAIECAKHEIIPPKSMAKDSEEFDEWLRANGELLPWAKAMGQYRSINAFLKKLEVMALRTRDDGTMPFGTLYAGAHTLRDSGDSGFNVQNMAREPMFGPELVQYEVIAPTPPVEADLEKTINSLGVDMRGMVEAPEGYLLGVVDLSAIEPCSLSILSGDEELAQMLRDGMDPYEAQARIDGEYDGSEPLKNVDKYLRQYNKVKVLGCLAVDTLILTEKGYLPASAIAENKNGLRLWDGIDWVTHEGYLDKGRQKTISIRGERITPDHEIFTSESQTLPAGALLTQKKAAELPWRPTPGTDWQDVWCLARGVVRALTQEWASCGRCLLHKLRKHLSSRKLGQFTNRQVPRMRGVWSQASYKNPNPTGMGARD